MFKVALVSLEPVLWYPATQPIRGQTGQGIERMVEGLANALQPVEKADGGQNMSRVGTHAAAGFEQLAFAQALKHFLKQEPFRRPCNEPAAELTKHRGIEARVSQLQTKRVLPV